MSGNISNISLENYPDVLDVYQLSEYLGVSKKTIYKLLKENEILSIKIGRSYKIPKIYVLRYLKIS